MLAQNFLSATDLGVTEVEKEALITVLGMLERGEIDDDHFKMSNFWKEEACGTVGCLCGWANFVSGKKAFPMIMSYALEGGTNATPAKNSLTSEVRKLFWIGLENWPRRLTPVTAEDGARVLREFLQTGKSTWK